MSALEGFNPVAPALEAVGGRADAQNELPLGGLLFKKTSSNGGGGGGLGKRRS